MTLQIKLQAAALALLAAVAGPAPGRALTVTIDDVVLTPPPGQDSIVLQGNFGAPRPGFLDGLRLGPSSAGVTPIVSVFDTAFAKGILLTDVAVTGPRSVNPFFYPVNSHRISIEHDFTPFGFDIAGNAAVGMSGSYARANPFVLGGELEVSGFLNGDQVNGLAVNNILTRPLFIPGVSELIYHPADDIRFRVGDLPNHSCDNIIRRPTTFSCFVGEPFSFQSGDPLNFMAEIDLTFVNPDTFRFPQSVDFDFVVPEPSALSVFAAGMLLWLGYRGRRRKRR